VYLKELTAKGIGGRKGSLAKNTSSELPVRLKEMLVNFDKHEMDIHGYIKLRGWITENKKVHLGPPLYKSNGCCY